VGENKGGAGLNAAPADWSHGLELKQQIRINAPRARVFAALNDPALLQQAIPGCEGLTESEPGNFEATVAAKVGPLSARFKGNMQVQDLNPPVSYTLVGEGKAGPAGHAKVRASVVLEEDGTGTLLNYEVKADVGGKLGQLGGAIIDRTAQKLAGDFFARFEPLIADPAVETAGEADATPIDAAPGTTRQQTWGVWYFMAAVSVALAAWVLLH
jgi:carbon monoxide dehydrogenase subunit G